VEFKIIGFRLNLGYKTRDNARVDKENIKVMKMPQSYQNHMQHFISNLEQEFKQVLD